MFSHPFPGFPAFLEHAAIALGHPEAAVAARRIRTLAEMANLCAQASVAGPAAVPQILAKAEEFRDQLHAAYHAAELMLAYVAEARPDAVNRSNSDPPRLIFSNDRSSRTVDGPTDPRVSARERGTR